jgi:ribosomal protein S18 acetylase RimI-like enzyme
VNLIVRPLTPDLWPALEQLFGAKGACNGCWCMYWRIGSAYHKRPREENRAALKRIVDHGPAPGLLAFDGAVPVGWCQLTPRADLPWLDRGRALKRVDDANVWSISCFYVSPRYRHAGATSALIAEAVKRAKAANVVALEAYPIDTRAPNATRNLFTGVASTFRRAGFRTIARRVPHRPIMRYDLAN